MPLHTFKQSIMLSLTILALLGIQHIDAMPTDRYAAMLDRVAAVLSGAPIQAQEVGVAIQAARLGTLLTVAFTVLGWGMGFVLDNWNFDMVVGRRTVARRHALESFILVLGTSTGRKWLNRIGLSAVALAVFLGAMGTALSNGPDLVTFTLFALGALLIVLTRTAAGRHRLWRVMRGHYRQIQPMR